MNTIFTVCQLPTLPIQQIPHHPFLDTGQRKASVFSGNVLSVGSSHHSHTHTSTTLLQVAYSGFSPTFQHHTATAIPVFHSTKSWQWLSLPSVFAFPTHKANAAKQIPLATSSQAKESLFHSIQLLPLPSAHHAFLVCLHCPVLAIPLLRKTTIPHHPFLDAKKRRHLFISATCKRQVQANSHTHNPLRYCRWLIRAFLPPFSTTRQQQSLHSIPQSLGNGSVSSVFAFAITQSQRYKANSTSHLKPSQRVFVPFYTVIALALSPTRFFGMPSLPCDGYPPSKKDHNTPPPISGCRKKRHLLQRQRAKGRFKPIATHTSTTLLQVAYSGFSPTFQHHTATAISVLHSTKLCSIPYSYCPCPTPTRVLWYASFFPRGYSPF